MLVGFRNTGPLPVGQSILGIGDIEKLVKLGDIIECAFLSPGLLGSGLHSIFESSTKMSHVLQFIRFDAKLSSSVQTERHRRSGGVFSIC